VKLPLFGKPEMSGWLLAVSVKGGTPHCKVTVMVNVNPIVVVDRGNVRSMLLIVCPGVRVCTSDTRLNVVVLSLAMPLTRIMTDRVVAALGLKMPILKTCAFPFFESER
jgi:hypothetical protein